MEKARAACLECNHINPAGHGGTISYEAAGERIVERERVYQPGQSVKATALPDAVEEKLRLLLHAITGLDSIDALLALHIANGGTCGNFGAYLAKLSEVINGFKPTRPGFRATAALKWGRLKKRFAPFGVLQSWAPGHGGGKAAGHK